MAEGVREVEETVDAFPAERRRDRSVGATDATVLRRPEASSDAGRAEAADRPASAPVIRQARSAVGTKSDPSHAGTVALRPDARRADAGAVGSTTTAEATLLPALREAASEPVGRSVPVGEQSAADAAAPTADSARFAEPADATLLPIARRSEPGAGTTAAESTPFVEVGYAASAPTNRVDSRPARPIDVAPDGMGEVVRDGTEATLLPIARRAEPAAASRSAEPAPTEHLVAARPSHRTDEGIDAVEASHGETPEPTLLPVAGASGAATHDDAAPLHRPRKTPDAAAGAAAPTIRVSVGRVEIRAKEKPAPKKPAGGWKAPVLSLDHYLRRGSGA